MDRKRGAMLLIATMGWMGAAWPAEPVSALLEKGIYQEETVGDLDAAIAAYENVVAQAKADRPLAAQALCRLAVCRLKQGNENKAFAALQDLESQFGGLDAIPAGARGQLADLLKDRATNNAPGSWVYFQSRETNEGPQLALTFGGAETAVPALQDAVLIAYLPDRPGGSLPQLALDMKDQNRVLLAFQLPSDRKASDLQKAELRLQMKQSEIPTVDPFALAVHVVEGEWSEKETTWLHQPAIRKGPLSTVLIGARPGPVRIDLTEIVKEWLNGATPNHGILLKAAYPFYGDAAPFDTSATSGKYAEAEIQSTDIEALFRGLAHGEVGRMENAQVWALIAKARLGGKETTDAIVNRAIQVLQDTAGYGCQRWHCCYVLGGIGDARAVPALVNALSRDEDAGVRVGAACALGECLGEDARKALDQAAKNDRNERVRKAAERALGGEFRQGLHGKALADLVGAKEQGGGVDLAVSNSDLTVVPYPEGGLYQAIVNVHNRGAQSSPKYKTLFYLGDPDQGGGLIHGTENTGGPIDPGGVSSEASTPFGLHAGPNKIVVLVNPDKAVPEADYSNNRAEITITIDSSTGRPVTVAAEVSPEARRKAEDLSAEGWTLWNQRKLKEAEQKFRDAVAADPTNADAWNGLGWARSNQGAQKTAAEAFERCLALQPRHAAALNGLAWIAKGRGATDEAIEYWKKAIDAMPGATAALNGLASTCMELKQYDKAKEYYGMWLKAEPNSPDAKQGLARAQEQIDKRAGAEAPKP